MWREVVKLEESMSSQEEKENKVELMHTMPAVVASNYPIAAGRGAGETEEAALDICGMFVKHAAAEILHTESPARN